jgi:hypothetical protein
MPAFPALGRRDASLDQDGQEDRGAEKEEPFDVFGRLPGEMPVGKKFGEDYDQEIDPGSDQGL